MSVSKHPSVLFAKRIRQSIKDLDIVARSSYYIKEVRVYLGEFRDSLSFVFSKLEFHEVFGLYLKNVEETFGKPAMLCIYPVVKL